jgi:hypothetical protein
LPESRRATAGNVFGTVAAPVRVLGADTEVPCVDGRTRRYVNLDNTASTPVMAEDWEAVDAFLPWYSSVHRGSGLKSQVAATAFEGRIVARKTPRILAPARLRSNAGAATVIRKERNRRSPTAWAG